MDHHRTAKPPLGILALSFRGSFSSLSSDAMSIGPAVSPTVGKVCRFGRRCRYRTLACVRDVLAAEPCRAPAAVAGMVTLPHKL